jgi:hypothetical protein
MYKFLRKVKKLPWIIGQVLTKKPVNPKSAISDLFIWRCNKKWNTYFELLDLAYLFGNKSQHKADIIFFNSKGEKFHQQSIKLTKLSRQVLDISRLLSVHKELPSEYGTFCIFHKKIPNIVVKLQSFITERGYVSYQYKNAPLSSYVHGNADAIDDSLTALGGSSFLNRQYNLQYLLKADQNYELSFINPSLISKKIMFKIVKFGKSTERNESITLKPKEIFMFPIKKLSNPSRLIVESKMIMARPIVFCFSDDNIDVFHG